jgi:hypothetical protein
MQQQNSQKEDNSKKESSSSTSTKKRIIGKKADLVMKTSVSNLEILVIESKKNNDINNRTN